MRGGRILYSTTGQKSLHQIAALLILSQKPLILPSLLSAEPVIAIDMDSVPSRMSGLSF